MGALLLKLIMTKFTVKIEALYSEVDGPERVYAYFNALVSG